MKIKNKIIWRCQMWSIWRSGLANLLQWSCYLQGSGLESRLWPVEVFDCNKVYLLTNRTHRYSLRHVPVWSSLKRHTYIKLIKNRQSNDKSKNVVKLLHVTMRPTKAWHTKILLLSVYFLHATKIFRKKWVNTKYLQQIWHSVKSIN